MRHSNQEKENCIMEIWKRIKRFPNYKISNLGRVYSRKRTIVDSLGRIRHWGGIILKPGISKQLGYQIVVLRKNRKGKTCYVHQLVWEAFNGEIPDGLETNHKDGNKANPELSNLELVTHSENGLHSVRIETRKIFAGCRLTSKIVKSIRTLYACEAFNQYELAIRF